LQIGYFELFTDGIDNDLGSIGDAEDEGYSQIMSLDISDMLKDGKSINDKALFETVIHELGHMITLGADQVEYAYVEDSDGSTYFIKDSEQLTFPDSYLNLFFQKFWNDIYDEWGNVSSEDDVTDFYNKYPNNFVTEYAATSPVEDIADTFMHFG